MEELGSNREPLSMDLRDLLLMNLLELNFIWKGPTNFLALQKLQKICVKGCPKLKTIFSPTIVKSLPGLIEMQISDCDELEQVFDIGDAQDHSTLQTPSQQVCFPNLDLVKVAETSKKGSRLEYLTTIRLTSLPNFKEIHHGFGVYVINEIIRKTNLKEIINDCPIYSSRKRKTREALKQMLRFEETSRFEALLKDIKFESVLDQMRRRGTEELEMTVLSGHPQELDANERHREYID
ncbi:hypothetical protein Fmac_001704 [Flemingia macrophylla]|uniref:Disease resistance protein At4g27190-like leucine-rich repeats domain-containing protein n=1 Tax=Flemingia macrophylla TaxID=520843 RepID=A0ABD1NHW3_9FABA